MVADANVSLRLCTPTSTRDAAELPPCDRRSAPQKEPRRRRRIRWALCLRLIAGGYSHVTSGQVMSTDNAYVEADKVGISTGASGIIKEVEVTKK